MYVCISFLFLHMCRETFDSTPCFSHPYATANKSSLSLDYIILVRTRYYRIILVLL